MSGSKQREKTTNKNINKCARIEFGVIDVDWRARDKLSNSSTQREQKKKKWNKLNQSTNQSSCVLCCAWKFHNAWSIYYGRATKSTNQQAKHLISRFSFRFVFFLFDFFLLYANDNRKRRCCSVNDQKWTDFNRADFA